VRNRGEEYVVLRDMNVVVILLLLVVMAALATYWPTSD
jgi:hypothetical protein